MSSRSKATVKMGIEPAGPSKQQAGPPPTSGPKIEKIHFPWKRSLFVFVVVLWSVEIQKSCSDLLLNREMKQVLPDSLKMSTYLLSTASWIFAGMLGMATILYFLLERKIKFFKHLKVSKNSKYYILLAGLCVHVGWSVMSVAGSSFDSFTGLYLQYMSNFGWYLVHPIRYLLIFHQQIPLPFLQSHMLVTFNEGLILMSNYACSSSLTVSRDISSTGFVVAWSSLLLMGIAWIVGIFLVKRYQNPISEDLAEVRKLYEHTDAISSFDQKQTPSRQLTLIAVLVPGVVLALNRAAISALLRHVALMGGNASVSGMQNAHADVIIAILTILSIEAIIVLVRKWRSDIFELIVIGITHALYVVALVLIALVIGSVDDIMKETPRSGSALVEIYLSEGHSNTAGYVLRNTSVEYGTPFMAKFLKRQIPLRGYLKEDTFLRIFNRPYGDILTLANITLESGKYQMFQIVQTGDLVKISKPNKVVPTHTVDPQVYVLNSIYECPEYDVGLANMLGINLSNARGVMFTGGVCAPVEVSFYVLKDFVERMRYADLDKDTIKEVIRVKPPAFDGVSPYITIPCQYPPLPNNSHTCVTVFQGYYRMFEYYEGIGKPFPTPEQQAFTVVSLKPNSINPRRLDYLTKPRQLINAINTISFRNVDEIGLDKLGVPFLFHGIATGIGLVSYIHLMWRQLPIPHRVLLVYGYFSLVFLVESIVPFLEAHRLLYTVAAVSTLFFIQVFSTAWHIVFSWILYNKMKAVDEPDAEEFQDAEAPE